jgi:hypothetical protein
MNNTIKNILYGIAIFLLLITIADMVLWFIDCARYEGFEAIKQAYHSRFPQFLRGHYTLTLINILCLSVATLIFIFCVQMNFLKKLSLGLAIFSGLLLYWNVFSLM